MLTTILEPHEKNFLFIYRFLCGSTVLVEPHENL